MPRKTKVPKELSKAVVEKKAVSKEKVEKKKAVPKEKVEKKKAVPKEKVEKKKAVPKEKVEKKKAVPKEKVEKKKAVPKEKVEKKKAVPKEKVEKKKAVPKEKVEKKKAVPKEKVEKKKAVPNEKVEKKKAVPKDKVEKKKAVPKDKVEKKKAVPKEKVEKKKASKGGKEVSSMPPFDTETKLENITFLEAKAPAATEAATEAAAKTYAQETEEAIVNAKKIAEAKAKAIAKTDKEAETEMGLIKRELIDIFKKETDKKKIRKEIYDELEKQAVQKPKKTNEEIYDELEKKLKEEAIQKSKKSNKKLYDELITELEKLKETDITIYNKLKEALDKILEEEKIELTTTPGKGIDDRINSFKISDEEINDATTQEKLELYSKEISDNEIIYAITPNVSEEKKLSFNDINEENRGIKEGDEIYYYSDATILQYEKVLQGKIDTFLQAKKTGGKKNIKHVRKAKYGKKYKGGMPKINKIAIMVKQKLKETVFGITLELDEQITSKITKECDVYRSELIKKSKEIIQGLTDKGQQAIVQSFFRYVLTEEEDNGKNSVVKAFHAKRKLDYATGDQIKEYRQKIYSSSNTLNSIQYVDSYIFNKLYRPNINCHVYGMQLPHQFDRVKLLGTMYKLHRSGIYSIVDLQDCNSGINGGHPMITKGVGCNLFDRNCEIDMWALAIATGDDSSANNAKYYGIEYADMSAGTLRTWNAISTIKNINDEKNKLVVHCLAGAGRTGSVILYLLMRDSQKKEVVKEKLTKEMAELYFGCDSIPKFIETKLLPYFTVVDDDVLSDNRYFIKHMIAELFELGEKKDDIDRIILFRKRLNFIIVFLARHFNIIEFVTYHHTDFGKKPQDFNQSIEKGSKITLDPDTYDKVNILLTVQFCQAYTVKISDWEHYNIDKILSDSNDPRYDEVMNWIE
jgi:neurofilament heavy polypeptide